MAREGGTATRQRLLDVGQEEVYLHGFQGASLGVMLALAAYQSMHAIVAKYPVEDCTDQRHQQDGQAPRDRRGRVFLGEEHPRNGNQRRRRDDGGGKGDVRQVVGQAAPPRAVYLDASSGGTPMTL